MLESVLLTFTIIDDSVTVTLNGNNVPLNGGGGLLRNNQPKRVTDLTNLLTPGMNTLKINARNEAGTGTLFGTLTQGSEPIKSWKVIKGGIIKNTFFTDSVDILVGASNTALQSFRQPTKRIAVVQNSGTNVGILASETTMLPLVEVIRVEGLVEREDGFVPGGYDYPLVSFQAVDSRGNALLPARYLHYDSANAYDLTNAKNVRRLILEELPSTSELRKFRAEATFEQVPALSISVISADAKSARDHFSFKAIVSEIPSLTEGDFIRQYDSNLLVTDNRLEAANFNDDATFSSPITT